MMNIHPTSTAGDGKSYPRRSTPKPSDVLDKRIRCAQCGFPFREDKETQGDSLDNAGPHSNVVVTVNNDPNKLPQPLRGMSAFTVSSKTISESTAAAGCRFCHTLNPKAIRRNDRAFDNSKDMSNR